MFTNLDLVLESTATLRMAATPSLFADYPCLQKTNMLRYTCLDFDLDALQAGISMNHREKFLQQRASRRVAMKRLYQRHPVGTVCVEQVNSEVVVTTLIFILILNQIRSKFANRIKVCNRAAVVPAIMSHKAKSVQATNYHLLSLETGLHNKEVRRSMVIMATTSPAMSCTETMCMFVVKGHMYLPMIIRQRLLMSGDVELNPGPLNALDLRSITNELGSVIDKWFLIGVQLGLSEAKLRQIEADYHSVGRCFSEVISFWLNGNTEVAVSWKLLVEVLESPFVDEKGLAKKLREKRGLELHDGNATPSLTDNQSVASDQSAQKSENSVVQLVSNEVDMVQEESPEHSHDLPQPKPKLTFPSLDLKKMSKEEKEQLHQRLYAESVDITFKFQKLFSSITVSLKEQKISPQDLYTHLACLGSLKPTYDDLKQPVLRHYFPQLRKAEHIQEAMAIIGDYCSFFNYHIIEQIIDVLGTTKDKDNLSNYKKEFSEYAKRHVFECPSELGTMTDGNATLFLTLDETYDNCTVSTLQLFVRKLAEILKLSSDAGLKLYRIEPGSLKLTFQIPIFLQEDIFPLSIEQRRALAGLGVVQLSCGEYQLTNEDKEVKLSGAVANMTSMVAGAGEVTLSMGKPDDTGSVADSAFETCSGFSGATSIGVSPFSGATSIGVSPFSGATSIGVSPFSEGLSVDCGGEVPINVIEQPGFPDTDSIAYYPLTPESLKNRQADYTCHDFAMQKPGLYLPHGAPVMCAPFSTHVKPITSTKAPKRKRPQMPAVQVDDTEIKDIPTSAQLWEFILRVLKKPKYYYMVSWENKKEGLFRFHDAQAFAALWGKHRNRPNMTYDKVARALRYYYKRDILNQVSGRLTYRFSKRLSKLYMTDE